MWTMFTHCPLLLVQILIIIAIYAPVHSSVIPASIGSIPNMRLFKHSQRAVDRAISNRAPFPINHDFSGASCDENESSIPKSFRVLNESAIVGHGLADFQRASELMFKFDMVNAMPWANVVLSSETKAADIAVGTVLCTVIKCYKLLWTLSPCRVCFINQNSGKAATRGSPIVSKREGVKLVNQIGYSTVEGHLISGEERFRVSLMSNDDVIFDLYSFTKGAGAVGTLGMPFIRPIQSAFFRDVTLSMKKIMSVESS